MRESGGWKSHFTGMQQDDLKAWKSLHPLPTHSIVVYARMAEVAIMVRPSCERVNDNYASSTFRQHSRRLFPMGDRLRHDCSPR